MTRVGYGPRARTDRGGGPYAHPPPAQQPATAAHAARGPGSAGGGGGQADADLRLARSLQAQEYMRAGDRPEPRRAGGAERARPQAAAAAGGGGRRRGGETADPFAGHAAVMQRLLGGVERPGSGGALFGPAGGPQRGAMHAAPHALGAELGGLGMLLRMMGGPDRLRSGRGPARLAGGHPGRLVMRYDDRNRELLSRVLNNRQHWRGAGQQEIEGNSGRFQIGSLEQLSEENKRCPICLCDFEEGEEVRALPCLHVFHPECVDRWLKDNRVCPTCKKDITDMERAAEQLVR
eukprot:TRINITY_DN6495_c0_g1_i3.p1 TRINITY_DN6495_c0_g1~~TRINITY_DN6495_c0_g1_i3.p1  ORF type:complete len:292 (+),score=67.24 TRINITY_DN6495_c0_g1_i3:72-947(+)